MHPLLSKYLDAEVIREALQRTPNDDAERALHAVARNHPEARDELLATKKVSASEDHQSSVIQLATFTALEVLTKNETFSKLIERVNNGMRASGLSDQQCREALGALLIEEAFGESSDDEHFQEEDVAEAIETLANLLPFGAETLDAVFESFLESRQRDNRVSATHVSDLLRSSTWPENEIALVTADDIVEVCEHGSVLGEKDKRAFFSELRALLIFLETKKWVGPRRKILLEEKISEAEQESPDEDESEDD